MLLNTRSSPRSLNYMRLPNLKVYTRMTPRFSDNLLNLCVKLLQTYPAIQSFTPGLSLSSSVTV